jgi:hypothetical protein
MFKRSIIAVIAVFVLWQVLDFIIHGVLLSGIYQETQELWRPMDEMKSWVMALVTIIASAVFVSIYSLYFKERNLVIAIKYGLIFGIGAGVTMGYGAYAFMPIPYSIAISWFLGTLVESVLAGLVLGLIVKDPVKEE